MTKHILVAFCAAMLAAPALAQAPAATPLAAAKDDLVRVAIDTEKGRIVVALDRAHAPLTVANFLAYIDKGWLNGQPFYRAMTWGDGGLIQAGSRDGAKQLPPILIDKTSATGLKNAAGAIVMANNGGKTTRSDFFILTADIPSLDATATSEGFAPFGTVIEGMDVVKAILTAPRSPTMGVGVMKGQMLEPVVKMVRVVRVKG